MRNRYYLMRHGESLANVADKIVSLPENGLEGYGLSEIGREQAWDSAKASGLPTTTIVIASDFLRTRHTAGYACEALEAAPFRTHPGLRERAFGELEGTQGGEYDRVWALDDQDEQHCGFGAESPAELVRRLLQVIDELEEQHQDADILLVSHGDPLRFLQVAAANRPLTEHNQVRHFAPAEIRPLEDAPPPTG